MDEPQRRPDFFDPCLRELRLLSAHTGPYAPAIAHVVDAVRDVVGEIAEHERAESDATGRDVVPLVSDHGDSSRMVGEIQMTAHALGEAFPREPDRGDSPGTSALTIEHSKDANKLGALGQTLAGAYSHRRLTSVTQLDQSIAELRMAYALAQEEKARTTVDRLGQQLRRLGDEATAIERKAGKAVEVAENAAGIKSQDELAIHFGRVKDSEREAALGLRQWAGRLGVGGPILAVGASLGGLDHVLALPLGLSIAGLGVYLGRLAEGHMKVARWAGTLEVQTLGVYGYSRLLRDRNAQDRVLEGFAAHAYTGHPGEPSGSESPLSAVTEVERLVRLVLEVQKKGSP